MRIRNTSQKRCIRSVTKMCLLLHTLRCAGKMLLVKTHVFVNKRITCHGKNGRNEKNFRSFFLDQGLFQLMTNDKVSFSKLSPICHENCHFSIKDSGKNGGEELPAGEQQVEVTEIISNAESWSFDQRVR